MTPTDMAEKVSGEIKWLLEKHSVKALLRDMMARQRTKIIKDKLCELGKAHDFRVAASGCAAHDIEWLYDMVWFKLDNDNKLLHHQAMVVECEWVYGPYAEAEEVDLDFQKLVQARADLRLWICAVPDTEIGRKKIDNCKKQIEKFDQSRDGDQYLFVVLVWEGDSSIIENYRAESLRLNSL